MAHRIRGHTATTTAMVRDRDVHTSTNNSNNVTEAQHRHAHMGKRKRDVLQDISEEHAGNGSSARQQQASAAGSTRRALAPRRPSPMAPARRASVRVRRSRRLSEQLPSAAGRSGGRTTSISSSAGAGVAGDGGAGRRRGAASEEAGGDSGGEGDDGGMSCDEDLEGMVVDLSFEGVADDSAWRALPDRRQQPAAMADSNSSGNGRVGGAASSNVNPGVQTKEGGSGARSKGTNKHQSAIVERSSSSRATTGRGNNHNSLNHEVQTDVTEVRTGRARSASSSNSSRDSLHRGSRDGRSESGSSTRSLSQSSGSTVEEEQDDLARTVPRRSLPRASSNNTSGMSSDHLETKLAPKARVTSTTPVISDGSSLNSRADESARARQARAAMVAKRLSEDRSAEMAGARTPLPAGVEDIDAGVMDEAESHLQNAEYLVEHAAFLRQQERRNRPAPYIGVKQKDMRQHMRSVLVDWIVEVCDQFKLSSRTLFQVVELIDRSLTAFEVARARLQLLGCACVVLASKYEEIYAPTAEELAHISDNTYTRAEIIAMELVVVNALQFRLTCITPCCFVDRFCRAARSNPRERSLVCYLLELLLQDYSGVALLPSLKAAAALYLARQTMHPRGCPREAWTKQTEFYTGYAPRALESCVRRLHALHVRAEGHNLHAVRDKYKRSQCHRVAEFTCAVEDALYFGDDE